LDIVTIIGTVAAVASTASFTPQAWKIIKSRKTDDISAWMFALAVTGFALWATYGALQGAWPLAANNAICFCLAGFILIMKLLPQREKERIADAVAPSGGATAAGEAGGSTASGTASQG